MSRFIKDQPDRASLSWTATKTRDLAIGRPYLEERVPGLSGWSTYRFLHICHLNNYIDFSPEELRLQSSIY